MTTTEHFETLPEQTVPGVTIKPASGGKDPADIAADLRDIADVIEDDPHLADTVAQLFRDAMWPRHALAPADPMRKDPRAVIAEAIRQFKPLASGPVEKDYSGDYFNAVIPLRALRLRLIDMRDAVCTRVVTGTETVTEEIPDPDYIAAAPTITQTREVETVEWQCSPIMAAGEQ